MSKNNNKIFHVSSFNGMLECTEDIASIPDERKTFIKGKIYPVHNGILTGERGIHNHTPFNNLHEINAQLSSKFRFIIMEEAR